MKLYLPLLAAAIAVATPVAQATTVDMRVIGTLTPPSCTIDLSNGGAINLGQIDLNTLNDAPNTLPTETIDVMITCSAPAKVATSVTEDRPGTAMTAGDAYFGLGLTSSSAPIGQYQVFGENGLADTVATPVISSSNGATWIEPAGGTPVEHGAGRKLTAVGTAAGPVAASDIKWTLRIEPTINATSSLGVTGNEAISGRMTLMLVYL
jgi:type 1 fimbria pilin